MMYRLLTIAVVIFWLAAMTALFVRDVWPTWTAQDSPPLRRDILSSVASEERHYSLHIVRKDQPPLSFGRAWNTLSVIGDGCSIRSTVVLQVAPPPMPPVRVETETVFDGEGTLDSFWLQVYGVPQTPIYVRGERHGIYFPCDIRIGPLHRQVNLEVAASRLIGDQFLPFSFLPKLRVGQSWRMQMLNPVAAVMSRRMQFQSLVARVSRLENIEHLGKPVECFVVETHPPYIQAWVDRQGRVLIQEVEWPGLGRLRVVEEPEEPGCNLRETARQIIPDDSEGRGWGAKSN